MSPLGFDPAAAPPGVSRAVLPDGRPVVVKRDVGAAAEAAGLRWLRVPGGPAVPEVLAAEADWLVEAEVPAGAPTRAAAEEFGRRLAALHAAGAPAFGSPPPGGPVDARIGGTAMRNEPGPTWPTWFVEHRIRPYLHAVPDPGPVEDVCARIEELAGPPEPPARLHGDLWSGNVLWSPSGVWLIDPAAHGGHRETDLAMLALFGLPHLDTVLAAYDEVAPLADGRAARVPLHQLFPLLVHAVLFGGGYAHQAVEAARQALRAR
ncbi:fructosamine kinase family protein [Pseudonocardia sp. WMMC193]|uniref:fructosamine kinase family protein n=1 Tax=Pseudonocardia sp. WMMC193 TaxID=2911965 RepID=UPI001F230313|nr:fructosamine kinase family protein [Pseudonocardia sp. WMMC193]MCF7548500.1 fructosamine kinase family protein [Pseudonocardia sp. WMMC193]